MEPDKKTLSSIIKCLKELSIQIRGLEKQAYEALYTEGDKEVYKNKLMEKATLLKGISLLVDENLSKLPLPINTLLRDRLGGFSFSAGKAIQLDSVFYMKALLYPEDYEEGDSNDLETFIGSLEEEL